GPNQTDMNTPARRNMGQTKATSLGQIRVTESPANPTLRTLIAIAQVLAVSVHELIPDSPPDIRAR
ncbi:hypothetical protein HDC31_003247, partial [Microbacterium sp. JAI119]|nr:hypothetical protein [Microbacterium sp. JAI119]